MREHFEKWVLGYYAMILIPVSIFQSIGTTDYGITMIVGNTLIMWGVIFFVVMDLIKQRTKMRHANRDSRYLWALPIMLLAVLILYEFNDGRIVPSFSRILLNEAGVAYCLITLVVIGHLIIHHQKVHKLTMHVISFVGLVLPFGIC